MKLWLFTLVICLCGLASSQISSQIGENHPIPERSLDQGVSSGDVVTSLRSGEVVDEESEELILPDDVRLSSDTSTADQTIIDKADEVNKRELPKIPVWVKAVVAVFLGIATVISFRLWVSTRISTPDRF